MRFVEFVGLFVLVGLVSCMFVPLVSASWSVVDYSGEWSVLTVDHLQLLEGWNGNWSTVEFTYGSVPNFSGFGLNYTVNEMVAAKREWFHWIGDLEFCFVVEFVKGSEVVRSWDYMHFGTDVFNQSGLTARKYGDASYGSQFLDSGGDSVDGIGVRLFTNDSYAVVDYSHWLHVPTDVIASDVNFMESRQQAFAVDLYDETVTINVYVGWCGSGGFDLTSDYNVVCTGGSQPQSYSGDTDFTEAPNVMWYSFLYDLPSIVNNYISFVPVLGSIAIPLLIISPFMLVLAVITACVSGVEGGGFQPLYNLAMRLWDMLAGVVSMIVGALSALKFW